METNQTAPGAGPVPEDAQGDSASAGQQAEGAVGSASAADASGPGFYAWLRRLGVPRRAGWLGGVCAGVGARLGIDPIIVRGIVVVVAVLGAPFVLLYAIAWLLLPDTDGQIQLERLTRGIVDPAIVGIAVMGVIGLIPLVQGGWLGWRWWPDMTIADPIFGFNLTWPLRVLWTLIVVGAIIALIVWLARRSAAGPQTVARAGGFDSPCLRHDGCPDLGDAPRPSPSPRGRRALARRRPRHPLRRTPRPPNRRCPPSGPMPTPSPNGARSTRRGASRTPSGSPARPRPIGPRALAPPPRTRRRAQELTAQAEAARAVRRASRPRTSAAYVVTVLGIALIGGAIAALRALSVPDTAGFAIPIAFAVATLAIALGMLDRGAAPSPGGFLAFTAIVATVTMLTATAGPRSCRRARSCRPGYGIPLDQSQRLVQPFGDAYMFAFPAGADDTPVVELTQGTGDTWLTIDEDARVVLDATDAGPVNVVSVDADGTMTQIEVDAGRPMLLGGDQVVAYTGSNAADVRLELHQNAGSVHIEIHEGE